MRRSQTARRKRQGGFIVVAVLWILAALAALVAIYANFVTASATVVAVSVDRLRAEALFTAALELTASQLLADKAAPSARRPSSGRFSARVGAARIAVEYRSEAARIDLNRASRELLIGLAVTLGADPAVAGQFADRVIGWRSPSSAENPEDDAEANLYRAAGLAYGPRHGPFPHVNEIGLLHGVPSPLVERMAPLVTVFNGRATVNVMDAQPLVVAALPGMTPLLLQTVLAARAQPNIQPAAVLDLLGPARSAATAEGGNAMRLTVRADLDNGVRASAEMVILLLDDDAEPYRILSWRDTADGAAAPDTPTAGLR